MTTAVLAAPDPAMEVAVQKRVITTAGRTLGIGIFLCLLGVLNAWVFGHGSGSTATASFSWNYETSASLPNFTVHTMSWCIALGVLCAAMGIFLIVFRKLRYGISIALLAVGASVTVFCLLMWAQRVPGQEPVNLGGFISLSVGYATIIIFGSMSGTIGERSGVVNIAIEGQFLLGAFCGAVAGSAVANAIGTGAGFWVGGLAGIAVGALIGLLLAYLSLRYTANQIIVGVVLVALAAGLTNYFNFQLLDIYSTELNVGNVAPPVAIPLLSKIPLLGPAFFDQNVYAYVADVLVIVLSFGLFRTQWGLRVRAVGEHPRAAETAGINVIRTRYKCVVLGGAIAGLGGAYYTLGQNGQFSQGMTAGLGYIALATMIFGRWRPYLCFAAAILFGVMTEVGNYVLTYNTGLNAEYLVILPYVVTILVVAGLVGHVRPPAADGVPYSRE